MSNTQHTTTATLALHTDGYTAQRLRFTPPVQLNAGVMTITSGTTSRGDLLTAYVDTEQTYHALIRSHPRHNQPAYTHSASVKHTLPVIASGNLSDGRLVLFRQGVNQTLYTNTEQGDGTFEPYWTGLYSHSPLYVTGWNKQNLLTVYQLGQDGRIYFMIEQDNALPSQWKSFSNAAARSIATGNLSDGRQVVLHIGMDHHLYYAIEPNQQPVWACIPSYTKEIVTGSLKNGTLAVFTRDYLNTIGYAVEEQGKLPEALTHLDTAVRALAFGNLADGTGVLFGIDGEGRVFAIPEGNDGFQTGQSQTVYQPYTSAGNGEAIRLSTGRLVDGRLMLTIITEENNLICLREA
ncbi:hypothetical protein [Brevibacillus dissolubilis]|uniref:hypothetical protein n=1 Tax=Brevibacillus dissolubilis TaxID=1844116 RepID=UPI001115F340|nr:hypothetical protein [Brevibacillus dissolubilis]